MAGAKRQSVAALYERYREIEMDISHLGTAYAMLDWDKATGMPEAAEKTRAEVLGHLAKLMHMRGISREYGALLRKLAKAADKGKLGKERGIIIEAELEDFQHNRKLPADFVERLAVLSAQSESVWNRAKPDSDWKAWRPKFRELVKLSREKAEMIGYKNSPYDALLTEYEPDVTVLELDAMFGAIKAPVIELVQRIKESPHQPSLDSRKRYRELLKRPISEQRKLNRRVAEALGFDFTAGRLDETGHHPFTLDIHRGDVRITTTYDNNVITGGLMTTVHEVGHALYAQGLPMRHYGTSGCMAPSFGIDESQSRLYENHVGRSLAFCEWLFGRAGKLLHRHYNICKPSLTRMNADEVTYPLHIILRYEIERALIEGKMRVDDVPDAWAAKMREYLGLEVPDHERGCMQDGHWPGGAFGYFPSYTVGDVFAAQLFVKATKEIRGLDGRMRRGNYEPLLAWLRRKVHRHGALYGASEILKKATGEVPNPQYLIDHLNRRYGELYKL